MTDNKKTLRSFQCRDALWERFEQMSRELECSVDYLLNEAMKLYARQREGGSATSRGPGSGPIAATHRIPPSAPPAAASLPQAPPPPAARAFPAPPAAAPSAPLNLPGIPTANLTPARGVASPPLPPSRLPAPGLAAPHHGLPAPGLPAPGLPAPGLPAPGLPAPGLPAPGLLAPGMSRVPGIPSQAVPPVPRGPSRVAPPPPPRSTGGTPQLSIYYGGERFVVNKDRFIIGRGKQTSDLTIKDPNVSRQHALVERHNNQYYMVDLGSTNGVEYAGQRVDRRLINNGDVFRVCDHDLRFSFA